MVAKSCCAALRFPDWRSWPSDWNAWRMGLELELAPELVDEDAFEVELAACDENWPPLGSSCESVAKSDCACAKLPD